MQLCFFQFRPKKTYKNNPKGGNIKNIRSHAIVFSGFFLSITINIIDIIIFITKNKENVFLKDNKIPPLNCIYIKLFI